MRTITKTVAELESEIYRAFYERYPDDDARLFLWPGILAAKKAKAPKKELMKILKSVRNKK